MLEASNDPNLEFSEPGAYTFNFKKRDQKKETITITPSTSTKYRQRLKNHLCKGSVNARNVETKPLYRKKRESL